MQCPIRDGVWRAEDPSREMRLHDLYSVGEPVDAFENAVGVDRKCRMISGSIFGLGTFG